MAQITSISWIDEKHLPNIGFWFVVGAGLSWEKKVILGLVATANPEPAAEPGNITTFRNRKQYRALASCELHIGKNASNIVLDPGYTPPFDKSKIHTVLREAVAFMVKDDHNYYAGESSPVSAIVSGKLHPASTLSVPEGSNVLVSSLIKFRAGAHTDKLGIEEAGSPFHVPWVWCEYALIKKGDQYRLLGNGSSFPSHAWYVDGTQVGKQFQNAVKDSEHEPAISSGRPASAVRVNAESDKSEGKVTSHDYAISAGGGIDADVTRFFR